MADEDMSGPRQDWERQCYAMAERTTDNAAGQEYLTATGDTVGDSAKRLSSPAPAAPVSAAQRGDKLETESEYFVISSKLPSALKKRFVVPAAPTQTPWTDAEELEFSGDDVPYAFRGVIVGGDFARSLERLVRRQQKALKQFCEDSMELQTQGKLGHEGNNWLRKMTANCQTALADYAALEKEIERG